MTAVAHAIGISRQHLSAMRNRPPPRQRGPPQSPDAELVADIRALVADLPTYGYGSCYTARDTRAFARDIGLVPRTTPVSSPQSNGMAEAFVRTLKRDYVRFSPKPDAKTVIEQLPGWLAHYNDVHPHRALGYRSPREYIAQTREAPSGL